jgi:hypothetical protein
MEEQEQEITSLEYFFAKILDVSTFYPEQFKSINNAFYEANKMYENELKESFEKGYEEGVKYTDGLISDERFPF